jgi:hypothetical protein
MLQITIPKPCHENWSSMSPNQQGRFCSSCSKTVVDFTQMSNEEVEHFFVGQKEMVCGRFHNNQLANLRITLPDNLLIRRMAKWKRFLAACLLIFSTTLFSCEITNRSQILSQNMPHAVTDTVPVLKLGEIAGKLDTSCIKPKQDPELQIMGKIMVVQPTMGVPKIIPTEEAPNNELAPAKEL